MGNIVLIRHGQASMFADDYDKLSPLGEEQSRLLGKFWSNRAVTFDEIYVGPRRRQIRTGELVLEHLALQNINMPQPVVIEEFDEYDGDGIINELLPIAIERDLRISKLAEEYQQNLNSSQRFRFFQRMFESVTKLWVEGQIDSDRVESWRSFHDRVKRGYHRILSGEGRNRRVAVFTSGGPISVAVQLATRAPEQTAIELNWRLRNCSLTEIVFSKNRLSLDSFNSIPHLEDQALWTYR
jgi:broad specificity phosphatase PhoE